MKENVKSPDFNPFPILLILFCFALLMWCFSEKASAADKQIFCTEEQIQNFEDMGLDKTSIFYFLSDNKIYNVYSWYDDVIYFNDSDFEFKVNNNYMTIGTFDEFGRGSIEGYSPSVSMYDYKDACILYVNENDSIKVENRLDTYLTNNGYEIQNEYSVCKFEKEYFSVPCFLMILNNTIISNLLETNNLFIIVFSSFAIAIAIILFFRIREVL